MGNYHRGLSAIFPQTMSRTMFCECCAQNNMPFIGNLVVFFGEKRDRFFCQKIEQDNFVEEYGFTPHIILEPEIIIQNEKQMIKFFASCGVHSCGIKIDNEGNAFEYLKKKECFLPIEEYIAFINNKDKVYYVNLKGANVNT